MFTIVGAGYAGRLALARLRIRCPDAPITLIEPRSHAENRIQLHQVAAGRPVPRIDLKALTGALGATHIQARVIQRRGRTLELSDGTTHTADALILAIGQRVRPAPGPAHDLKDQAAAERLHQALRAQPDARVTIVGAGFTALETVTWLAEAFPDARFTLWRAKPRWENLGTKASAVVDAHLAALGVQVLDEGPVLTVASDHARSASNRHAHDHLVWLTGTEPHEETGRLTVDPHLAVEPGVFAAGDLAILPGLRCGCVTAMPTGAHAAENAVRFVRGEALVPFGFRDLTMFLSLGPRNGIVQFLGPSGAPTQRVFHGRFAALTKALILRYVTFVYDVETHRRIPLYKWPQGRAQPLLAEPA